MRNNWGEIGQNYIMTQFLAINLICAIANNEIRNLSSFPLNESSSKFSTRCSIIYSPPSEAQYQLELQLPGYLASHRLLSNKQFSIPLSVPRTHCKRNKRFVSIRCDPGIQSCELFDLLSAISSNFINCITSAGTIVEVSLANTMNSRLN